jgi:hypothetical protein
MSTPRNTYKFNFKVGNKVIKTGITKNLMRREAQLKRVNPSGHVKQVGRRSTRGSALEWRRNNY